MVWLLDTGIFVEVIYGRCQEVEEIMSHSLLLNARKMRVMTGCGRDRQTRPTVPKNLLQRASLALRKRD